MKASTAKKTARLTPAQARIRASVDSAKRKVITAADCRTQMVEAIDAAGEDLAKKNDAALFGALKILGPNLLDKARALELVQLRAAKAVADRDGNLLIRLGRALQKMGIGTHPQFDKLDLWLINAWLPQGEGMFGLCDCTDVALTDFLKIANSRENLTLEAVVKRRQRLGLVKSDKPTVTGVRMIKGKVVFSFR